MTSKLVFSRAIYDGRRVYTLGSKTLSGVICSSWCIPFHVPASEGQWGLHWHVMTTLLSCKTLCRVSATIGNDSRGMPYWRVHQELHPRIAHLELCPCRLGFLPDVASLNEEVYLRSTNVPRTVESLQQITHGLYPESKSGGFAPQLRIRCVHLLWTLVRSRLRSAI